MSSRRSAPGPDDDPSYELGDLELAPLPARPPPKPDGEAFEEELTTVLPELRTAAPSNDLGLEFSRGNQAQELHDSEQEHGFGDAGFEGPALELDLPGDSALHARRGAPPEPPTVARASFAPGSLAPSPTGERPSRAPGRSSRAPLSGSPEDDQRAARTLAGYGQARSGLDAARYLLHVGLRMIALHRERRAIEQQASQLATSYDKALLDLGRALLDDQAVRSHDGLREHVQLVLTRQGELSASEHATQAARADEQQALAELGEKRAALEAALEPFSSAEKRAEAAHQQVEAELKRKKAKLQRADIELRALTRASAPPPPDRVQAIEAERQAQQAELSAIQAAQAETQAALVRARRELSLQRAGLDDLEREQAQKQRESRARGRGHEEQVARAEHALSAALCGLAEAADGVGLAHSAAEQVAGLRASESALDVVVDQLARYDRALTLYDRPAALRGAAIWLALIGVVLLLIRLL